MEIYLHFILHLRDLYKDITLSEISTLSWSQQITLKYIVPLCDTIYEEHLESKERFAIKKYLLIIRKKKNMQVLSHNFTYFST